jgi:hypothetical protein
LSRVSRGHLASVVTGGHHGLVGHDDEATQLMLEALFDVKAAVFEIREYLIGGEDGSEEEEEEDS